MTEELKTAIRSVLEAGEAIHSVYQSDFSVRMKGYNNPVTEADLFSHQIVRSSLLKRFPSDFILSEEDENSSETRLSKERVWILDPLDGTRDFVEKNPEFAVSLGLAIRKEPVLGVLLNPVTKELFWGMQNLGYGYGIWNGSIDENQIQKFLSESRLLPTERKESSKKIIMVSRKEKLENLFSSLESLQDFQSMYTLSPKGSIAYKLGLLMAGKCDLVLSLKPKNEWDICGGIAILKAGRFKAFPILEPKPYSFNNEEIRTYGLIAGREEVTDAFWKKYENLLRFSLRK